MTVPARSAFTDAVNQRNVRHLPMLAPKSALRGVLSRWRATRLLLEETAGPTWAVGGRGDDEDARVSGTVRNIAVGFDGSPDSIAALRWAVGLARQSGFHVAVIHAVGLLEYDRTCPPVTELEHTARAVARQGHLPESAFSFHRVDGDPCAVLSHAVNPPLEASLVVVGSRGAGAHRGQILGSSGHQLAERLTVPVVIVPTHEDHGSRDSCNPEGSSGRARLRR